MSQKDFEALSYEISKQTFSIAQMETGLVFHRHVMVENMCLSVIDM